MKTTRDKLIDAARQCLLARGHSESSVKAIAGEAGVNHGLVHRYFGSKEGLWVAVVEREASRCEPRWRRRRRLSWTASTGPSGCGTR